VQNPDLFDKFDKQKITKQKQEIEQLEQKMFSEIACGTPQSFP